MAWIQPVVGLTHSAHWQWWVVTLLLEMAGGAVGMCLGKTKGMQPCLLVPWNVFTVTDVLLLLPRLTSPMSCSIRVRNTTTLRGSCSTLLEEKDC